MHEDTKNNKKKNRFQPCGFTGLNCLQQKPRLYIIYMCVIYVENLNHISTV